MKGFNLSLAYRLRAQFGTDAMKNAVHGSSTVEKAEKVIKEFLPEVEIMPDGTVRGLNVFFFAYADRISMLSCQSATR